MKAFVCSHNGMCCVCVNDRIGQLMMRVCDSGNGIVVYDQNGNRIESSIVAPTTDQPSASFVIESVIKDEFGDEVEELDTAIADLEACLP